MNLFEDVGVLCGNFHTDGIKRSIERLCRLSDETKKLLGDKSNLLNNYLLEIFNALNCTDIVLTIDEADEICEDIFRSCSKILKNDDGESQSEIYQRIKRYIDDHAVEYSHEHTKIEFYTINVLLNEIDNITKDFISKTKSTIKEKIDYSLINQKYKEISDIVGEHRLDSINALIDDVFIICPVSMVFVQLIIQRLIGMMLYLDPETKKYMLELILEPKN